MVYIDNISQVIEEGPVVRTDHIDVSFEDLGFNSLWTVKNMIFYSCEHYIGRPKYLSLIVVHLGADVVQRHFWLDTPTVRCLFSVSLAPLTSSSEHERHR